LAGEKVIPSASPEVTNTVGAYDAHKAAARVGNTTADQNIVETDNMASPGEAAAARAAALRKTNAEAGEAGLRGKLYGAQAGLLGVPGSGATDPARAEIVKNYSELSRTQGKAVVPPAAYEKRYPGISAEVAAAWNGMGSDATAPLASRTAMASGDKLGTMIGSLSQLIDNVEMAPTRMGKLAAAQNFTEIAGPLSGAIVRAVETGRVSDQDRAFYKAMLVPLSGLGSMSTVAMLQTAQYRAYTKQRLAQVEALFQKISDQGKQAILGEGGAAPAAPTGATGGGAPTVGQTKVFPNGKTGVWDGQGWAAQ
jgi:hypothetical protein